MRFWTRWNKQATRFEELDYTRVMPQDNYYEPDRDDLQ